MSPLRDYFAKVNGVAKKFMLRRSDILVAPKGQNNQRRPEPL